MILAGFKVHRRTGDFNTAYLAKLSFHSVARWYERRWVNTTDALLSDILVLAAAIDSVDLTLNAPFTVEAHGGRWVGTIEQTLDQGKPQNVLGVRTFLV